MHVVVLGLFSPYFTLFKCMIFFKFFNLLSVSAHFFIAKSRIICRGSL
jgi:hypothetical protein